MTLKISFFSFVSVCVNEYSKEEVLSMVFLSVCSQPAIERPSEDMRFGEVQAAAESFGTEEVEEKMADCLSSGTKRLEGGRTQRGLLERLAKGTFRIRC